MMGAGEPLVTMREAARLFGLSHHLLFRAAEEGELEVLDLG